MRSTLLIATLASAMTITACGPPDDTAPTPEPTGQETAVSPVPTTTDDTGSPDDLAAMEFEECQAERYTVGYPAEWNTNDPQEGLLGPCEIFHPGPIDEPDRPRDRDLHYAVITYVDEIDFEDRTAADNPNDVLEERETTVDDRRALVVEFRSTGDALLPEGERSYSYTVDLDGEILVAATYSVGDTDYERDKRILDRMITEELTVRP